MCAEAAKPWEHAKSGAGSEADPAVARFVSSLDVDKRLYRHDIRGSIAHAQMLADTGLIAADERDRIAQGLEQIEREIDEQGDDWPGWKLELEDVHMCIEAALIEKIGDAGRKLHTGRSRNDQVATDLHLWLIDASRRINAQLETVCGAFVGLAERDGRITMPSYTHLQRAQPIVAGAELLAWATALWNCRCRFDHVMTIDRASPLGSGAIAGSALPLDRRQTARALFGQDTFAVNSIEATASRDAAIDFVYALAMTGMWLSRWAEQWIIYASNEFGFVTLDERYTTGSSMMPQKQNPDMLELIRGRCGTVYGHLIALLTMCKGLTIGYNRDLQEDKRHVFSAYDLVSANLEVAAKIVSTSRLNRDKISASLEGGYLDATSLAEYLVTRGVPFRTAHQHVGRLVRLCERENVGALSNLSLEQFHSIIGDAAKVDEQVYDWLTAANVVERYQTAGNGGLSGLERQLAGWRQRLSSD